MDHLPENLQTVLNNPTISFLRSTVQSQLTSQLSNIRTAYVDPYLITPLSNVLASTAGSSGMPDFITILVLAGTMLVSLILLDYLRRMIMWWVRMMVRFIFWGTLIVLGLHVYRVGLENAVGDLGKIWGFVEGFVQQSKDAAAGSQGAKVGRGGWGAGWG
ncbi:uncharacterized protein N7482_007324 [Penicillium canariense]|uniref:Nuclear pore assembly and biogenesis protein, APQ12 n=1 Tax=Penicillium canariense TaxID=189055 RepID=A0A9W9HZB6_9EURO|nr:uncharacterized protein N7482_007324 [Penicillium canariense]KAJ5160320.1 hypothetical protein N7482_007324 [Penicillium canariense]